MAKRKPAIRRYQQGGQVDPNYMSRLVNQGFDTTRGMIGMANAVNNLMGSGKGDASPGAYRGAGSGDVSGGTGSPTAGGGSRKGGPIRKTYGPKLGKEDGVIAAQKGEYVVRKSAVHKLGKKALDTINKGKLPARAGKR